MTDSEIANAIRNALARRAQLGQTGVVSVMIDGLETRYDEKTALVQLDFWERRAARSSGRRPTFTGISLENLW